MRKLNRLVTSVCLLFAVNACGKTEYVEEPYEEEEEDDYVDDNNNVTPTPTPKPDEQKENPIFETDSGKAYKKLVSLANEQLIAAKNLNASTEYVAGIVSVEYTSSKVVFCALGDKQDNTNYFVKVTMNYAFSTAEDFISTMVGIDAKTASTTYSVTSEVKSIYGEPQVNNKFHELKSTNFAQFDSSKFYSQCCYRADNSETNYFAFTFEGKDNKIHSINEMTFDFDTGAVTVTSEYQVASSESEKMGKLFDIILENY